MEEILKQIFSESGYVQYGERLSYYTNDNKSFYFVLSISEANFSTLKSAELIRDNQQYNDLMDGFKELVNSGSQIAIEKNSSLIILVNCSSIQAIVDFQQQVLLFEEDQYFFKKYVILYTTQSISALTESPLIPVLRTKINDNEIFNRFSREGYISEIAEYIVIMQLFIKLPFLRFDHGRGGFVSLNQKIAESLKEEVLLYEAMVANAEDLISLDFTSPEDELKINELLSLLPHD